VFRAERRARRDPRSRESGTDARHAGGASGTARKPIEAKRDEHERALAEASEQWDRQAEAPADQRRATLETLRQLLLERNYITNLLAASSARPRPWVRWSASTSAPPTASSPTCATARRW
jgi:hypothetical protein